MRERIIKDMSERIERLNETMARLYVDDEEMAKAATQAFATECQFEYLIMDSMASAEQKIAVLRAIVDERIPMSEASEDYPDPELIWDVWIEIGETLDFKLSDSSLSGDDLAKLLEYAKSFQSYKMPIRLLLDGNVLDSSSYKKIADFIATTPAKIEIDLSMNAEVAENFAVICEGLKRRKENHIDAALVLNVEGCSLASSNILPLVDLINEGHCPDNLKIDMSKNKGIKNSIQLPDPENELATIDTNGARLLAKALVSGNCPENLNLDFTRCKMDIETTKEFVAVLDHPKCPQGLRLELRKNTVKVEGDNPVDLVGQGAKAMLTNTKVTGLMFSPDDGKTEDHETISICVKRNKLMQKYPRLADYIKRECQKEGIYVPPQNEKRNVPSLMSMAAASGLSMFSKGQIKEMQDIPQEVKDFVSEVNKVNQKLGVGHRPR